MSCEDIVKAEASFLLLYQCHQKCYSDTRRKAQTGRMEKSLIQWPWFLNGKRLTVERTCDEMETKRTSLFQIYRKDPWHRHVLECGMILDVSVMGLLYPVRLPGQHVATL